MVKWLAHLRTINHHKRLVMMHCFRVGLYRQGIMHDLSKYSPVEFLVGAKYFQGNRSPNEIERKEKGYSSAWLHHKGRNKHHLEYWLDYSPTGDHALTGMEMPVKYVVEMFCDRMAASKTYRKGAYRNSDPLRLLYEFAGPLPAAPENTRFARTNAKKAQGRGRRSSLHLYQAGNPEKQILVPGAINVDCGENSDE